MKEQHETDAGTEHQLTAGERRHAQIKKWENDNDLKYLNYRLQSEESWTNK